MAPQKAHPRRPLSKAQGMKWRVVPETTRSEDNWWRRLPLLLAQAGGQSSGRAHLYSTLMIVVLSALFWELRSSLGTVNIALLYIFPILVSSLAWGLWPSIYSAGLSIVVFDFLFVPPIFSFAVGNLQYVVSFAVFLLVGSTTAILASSLRLQYSAAMRREAHAQALFRVTRQIASHSQLVPMLKDLIVQIEATLRTRAIIAVVNAQGEMEVLSSLDHPANVNQELLKWVKEHGEDITFGDHHVPELMYLPLKAEGEIHGVLCVGQVGVALSLDGEAFQLLQSLAELTAVALFQHQAAEKARLASLSLESERLRTALLDSVSHELMTPLSAVTGSVTALLDHTLTFNAADQEALLSTIREGAARMRRLITNLLGMVKIESGMIRPNWQEVDLSDVIGIALRQLDDTLRLRRVEVHLPDDLPLLHTDPVLLEQVLVNIISNAEKYSPPQAPIVIDGASHSGRFDLSITDRGMGMSKEDRQRAFEKFYRGEATRHIPGTGLGLAISKSVIEVLGGRIEIHPNIPHGTQVLLSWDWNDIVAAQGGNP